MDSLSVVIDTVKLVVQDVNNNWLTIEMVSVLVALLAVIVAPFIQFIISKNQIKAQLKINDMQIKSNVLSKNRQDWIHRVRDDVSNFITNVSLLKMKKISQNENINDYIPLYEKILRLEATIKMQLSAEDSDHVAFSQQMKTLITAAKDKESELKYNDELQKLTKLGQKIFEEVWEKVKSLK